jgi:hypothetical protein
LALRIWKRVWDFGQAEFFQFFLAFMDKLESKAGVLEKFRDEETNANRS